jgi:vacuolar-type H+-ATPase subunit E/Vma4
MSIELEASLIENAVSERNAILEKSKERAKRIMENALSEEKRLMSDADRHIKTLVGSEIRAVHDRIVGRAELEGRKIVMDAKMELIDSVLDLAEKQLTEIASTGGPRYQEIMKALVKETVTAIDEDKIIILSNKKDQRLLQEILAELTKELGVNFILETKAIEVLGGIIAKNTKGTKIFYNTFGGRLSKVKQTKISEIAEKLGVI